MQTKSELKQEIATKMIELRLVQKKINESYKKGKFKIPVHLALGHEAIAVAVDQSMKEGDKLVLSHRNIHYNYLKIRSAKKLLNEYLLNEEGVSAGEQGSMNLNNPEKGLIYTSNILANNLCVATGIAMAESVKQKSAVTTVITGDGAMEEGAFYESLLFMKSNHVSAIIVIENNEWSLATKIEERRHAIDVEKLVSSVNAKYISLKGNNVFEYVEAMNSARETAAKEKQVVVVEVKLSSLGHWIMKNDLNPNGKYINYHAGPAPTVDYEADIIIENSPEDPLSVLKTLIPVSDWDSIAMKIKANLEQEVGA